jgi:hypothetical protein
MVGLNGSAVRAVPLGDAVHEVKRVSIETDVITTARRVGISFGG